MSFLFNDGGRNEAQYKGVTGDCVTRAISIVTGVPYQTVYDEINKIAANEKVRKNRTKKSSARTGVFKETSAAYLTSLGWVWTPTMTIGSGCKVHLKSSELPLGKIICKVTKHMVAVIDGVINDTYDCSRQGTRCVYGYWSEK